jgi:hypothetical protein
MTLTNERMMCDSVVREAETTAAGRGWMGRMSLALRKFLTTLLRTLSAPAF